MTDFSLFKTYGAGIPAQVNVPISFRVNWQVYSEQWLDNLPNQLMAGGMTCPQARDYLLAHYDTLINRIIVKRDTVLEGYPGAINFAYNGTGSPPDYGSWYMRTADVTDLDVEYVANVFVDALSAVANIPVDGSWNIFDAKVFASYPSTNPGSIPFDYSAWLPTMQRITSIDVEQWFCNVTSCCGVPSNPSTASHFLIPASSTPNPVEEKASVPILRNAVYLSNHTFQFVRNFGRLNK